MTSLKFVRGSAAPDPLKVFHVAVVGTSGCSDTQPQDQHSRERSNDLYHSHELVSAEAGSGKSCLCNRFVRPAEDDYLPQEHVSVLSATDFSSAPINNDHCLYWGEARRTSDDGHDCVFSLIEQTEFIDDSNFQPFRNGRNEKDYSKRASNIKVQSPGKIQYYGRSQLGIENEFPMIPMPDGRFNVDGFVCTFDLSSSGKRSIARQVDTVFQLLCHIVRQKKPVVLAATKADDGNSSYLLEANKLLHRKELKGAVQLVETSAHRNVNVDAAFMLLAQLVERTTSGHTQLIRHRLSPYADAAAMRKERMETAAKAFEALIRTQVKERKMTWQEASRKFHNDQDFKFYCELWGTDSAKRLFSNFMRQLRDREAKSRLSIYLSRLDRIFRDLLTDVSLVDSGWSTCLDYIQSLSVFDSYFADLPSGISVSLSDATNFLDDDTFYDSGDTRVPSRILLTADAERCFITYADALRREEKQRRLRKQFVDLLNITPYALPGRSFRDVCVFLATEPAYTDELNELNVLDKQELYEAHQRKITEETKEAFLELLLENVALFQQKQESNKPAKKRKKEFESKGKLEEDSLSEIEQILRTDRRYRAMDLLAQRDAMLRKMWMYYQSPFPEACPVRGGCFDTAVKGLISRSVKTPENLPVFTQCCLLDAQSSSPLKIVLLGRNDLAENFHRTIRTAGGDDELKLDGSLYSIDFRLINGDLSQPQNAFQTPNYLPHGCFCIYDSKETFQYVRSSMENALRFALLNEEEDSSMENIYENSTCVTPCNGLPTVLVFEPRADFKESEVQRLRECGQDLSGKLQCAFLELPRVVHTSPGESLTSTVVRTHKEEVVVSYLKTLVRDIQTRSSVAKSIGNGNPPAELFDCDMRLRFCVMCGDNGQGTGFVHHVLGPLMSHTVCYQTTKNPQGFVIETYVSEDTKCRVEIDCKSYHDSLRLLNPYNLHDEGSTKRTDGLVLVFALRRKASSRSMRCLMDMLLNQNSLRPAMVLAVVESVDGASAEEALFLEQIEQLCLERKSVFLATNVATTGMSIATYTPLLRLCWEYKLSAYDRASTATLNSTVPSLSDEEAVLISKSRSLERERQKKPTVMPRHTTFVQGPSRTFEKFVARPSGGLQDPDSPTFRTFGIDQERARARTETNSSDDLIAPTSRLGLEESTQLRATRSTEDILAYPNGHHTMASDGPSSTGEMTSGHYPDPDGGLRSRVGPCRTTHRKSVPSELEDMAGKHGIFHRPTHLLSKSSNVRSAGAVTGRLHSKAVPPGSGSPRKVFTRSSSALNVTSPSGDEAKRGFHPFMRGLAAWQARSADEGTEKSASQRLVGKLTSGGKYSSFIDQLNANIARGSQQSPTAPLAIPELVEDREHESIVHEEIWNGSATSLKSPACERQFLIGLKTKKPRPPDRYGFRRVVAPPIALPGVLAHHLSLSQDDTHQTFPMRASLPDFLDRPAMPMNSQAVMSPLDDNVFFSSPVDEELKNGTKPNKSSKPKREKENKSSVKKSKDKKKKVDPTFENFVQSPENPIPLFIEKCIKFIEAKGIDTEGIYRVSGSRVHADQLLSKFLSHPSSVDLFAMDIPIYNVTTAMKTYMTEHTPPVIPQSVVDELHDLSFVVDKAERLQLIKSALAHLSATHFQLLKYMIAHLRRISENSKKNKMDANNLTVCLWPTLCPIELPNDMARFEGIRVEVSEIISSLIVEYDKIFEPHYSPSSTPGHTTHLAAVPHMGSLAQEAAEAVRQRSTRHSPGHGGAVSQQSPLPATPPSSSVEISSDGASTSSLTKGPVVASLKSVQV